MALIEQRKNGKGELSYRVKVRLKGFPSQTATFKTKTHAKEWATKTEAAIREGRHFKNVEAKKRTLSELIDKYTKSVLPRKTESQKYIKNQSTQLQWWKDKLGAYSLAEVTPARISGLKDELLEEKGSPATVNRYLAALSHLFTKAVREWEWIETNPVSKVDKEKEPKGRTRFLDNIEKKNLLEACKEIDEELYLLVLLAISTGARKGELLEAKWADLDLKKEVIIFYKTKNGEIRRVPIKGLALETLKTHRKQCSKEQIFIFKYQEQGREKRFERLWDKALIKVGINEFRFHDLRHTSASYLAMNGASIAEIAEVLGHKTLAMVKRYSHLTEAHTANIVERMNREVFG